MPYCTVRTGALTIALALLGCGHPGSAPAAVAVGPAAHGTKTVAAATGDHFVLRNARLPGGDTIAIEIRDGVIASLSPDLEHGLPTVDAKGSTLVPGFIDSQVHLAYHFGEDAIEAGQQMLRARGVVAAVDLAAPVGALGAFDRTRWLAAGPMITAVGGYPTRSWGAGGYGLEIAGTAAAEAAVDQLVGAGASLIKVPVESTSALSELELEAVVARAHAKGVKVVAHALGDGDAARAAKAGVDVLAHTPLQPLSDATVALWRGRAVVSTLAAFGGSASAIDNLRRLHTSGTAVVYGTDLGNARVEGIDDEELELLSQAGLTAPQILDAGTRAPAELWGMPGLGSLAIGASATFLVLEEDPYEELATLADPTAVYVDGVSLPLSM